MRFLEKTALAFDDVRLVPQYSEVRSRSHINLSVVLKNTNLKLNTPFLASPMSTVSESKMAQRLDDLGGLAIIHRYCSIEAQAKMVASLARPAAAVGVSGDFIERAQEMVSKGAVVLCIDIAHAHHILMKEALEKLRKMITKTGIHFMAGNVATPAGFIDLGKWWADSVRASVGSGSICSTTIQTGHGKPALQTVLDITEHLKEIDEMDRHKLPQIILDGGIVKPGDIAKGIAAGADLIMMGSMFAGTDESPGEVFEDADGKWKKYSGMASKSAQIEWRGFHSSDEGIEAKVRYKGPVENVMNDLSLALRSALSYSGAKDLSEFRKKAIFTRVSQAAAVEASPHILLRA